MLHRTRPNAPGENKESAPLQIAPAFILYGGPEDDDRLMMPFFSSSIFPTYARRILARGELEQQQRIHCRQTKKRNGRWYSIARHNNGGDIYICDNNSVRAPHYSSYREKCAGGWGPLAFLQQYMHLVHDYSLGGGFDARDAICTRSLWSTAQRRPIRAGFVASLCLSRTSDRRRK